MDQNQFPYMAYMLRLWLEDGQGQGEWRASLEDPHTQEMQVFADLEALFDFLTKQTEQQLLLNTDSFARSFDT